MARLPEHGTMRRYRAGCTCDRCRAKNADEKRKQRERSSDRAEAAGQPARPKRARAVRVTTAPVVPTAPTPIGASVSGMLALALAEVEADDALTNYRKQHALTMATVLDDPRQARLWRGITTSLHEVLELLVSNTPPTDGEGAALAGFMEEIRRSRESRGRATPVHDAAESGEGHAR